MSSHRHFSFTSATSVVIANMIGAGVFTSLAYQAHFIKSPTALLMIWVIGGIAALAGALCYGELGAALPRSGGEYNFLSEIYHPAVGFLSGWVSVTVAFAAPVALAAMKLGTYTASALPNWNFSPVWLAACIVVAVTLIHAISVKAGSRFQNYFTALKVLMIVVIVVAGFMVKVPVSLDFNLNESTKTDLFSSAFAISLFFVSYAYSGWNAAAYIAGEVKNPQRNLPRALFTGTLVVMLLYLLINFIFLYTVPLNTIEYEGFDPKIEIGALAAMNIFGSDGGRIVSGIIALLLLSSVSSMVIAGPRVTQVMGEDLPLLNFFAKKTTGGAPARAIATQCIISLLFIFTATFEQVITYIGFTLNLFTFLTVLGVFVLRIRKPDLPRPYKTWGYPITPIIFLAISSWLLYYGVTDKPQESLAGFATIFIGYIVYFLSTKKKSITA